MSQSRAEELSRHVATIGQCELNRDEKGEVRYEFEAAPAMTARVASKTSNRVIVLRGDSNSTKVRERGINRNASTVGFVG